MLRGGGIEQPGRQDAVLDQFLAAGGDAFVVEQARTQSALAVRIVDKLDIGGKGATNAILKSWQVDPIREHFLHADFYRIAMDVAIRVTVPIATKGEARGVKVDAGILELVVREIEVECLPGDIPERIEVNVEDLGINDALRVSDIPAIPKVKVLTPADQVVVHVVSVKEEEVAPIEQLEKQLVSDRKSLQGELEEKKAKVRGG